MHISKVFSCNPAFQLIFVHFLADDLPALNLVCRNLHKQLKAILENKASIVREKCILTYGKYFPNPSAQVLISAEPRQSQQLLQTRIKISLTLAVGNQLSNNRSYILGYSYEYADKKKHRKQKLFWELQFDVKPGERCIWMYREETRNHFAKGKVPLLQDIIPVRKGDNLRLEVAFLTSFGFSLLDTLEFYPIVEERLHQHFSSIENLFQWTLHKYLEHPVQFQVEDIIRCYPDHLQFQEMRCSGVGFYNYRIKLRCIKKGLIGNLIGHDIEILGHDDSILVPLKKKGAYDQQRTKIQLRVGDVLLIYFTPHE